MAIAVVTGASSGFGKEFAYQLAEKGYNLHLVARGKDKLEEIKTDISNKYNVEIKISIKDLTEKADVISLVQGVKECDLLINCAGFGFMCDFTTGDLSDEQDMIELNIKSLHYLTKEIGKMMVENKSGGIINVASISAFQPVPYFSVYAATKAFVLNYSLGINKELKKHGIHVMAICPGFAATGFYNKEQLNDLRKKTFKLPIFIEPHVIVRKGIRAFLKKKRFYIPGFINRIVVGMNCAIPRGIATSITANIFKYLSK